MLMNIFERFLNEELPTNGQRVIDGNTIAFHIHTRKLVARSGRRILYCPRCGREYVNIPFEKPVRRVELKAPVYIGQIRAIPRKAAPPYRPEPVMSVSQAFTIFWLTFIGTMSVLTIVGELWLW